MDICAGANLGRYHLQSEIGRGAMGVVFQALDPEIDRLVAIKVFSVVESTGAEGEAFRQRFAREARAAGRLIHPGIVTVYDVGGAESGIPFIVMEYVPGQPLSRMLAATATRLEERFALRLAKDVAEALAFAHEKRVVHRDIKPANILITGAGAPKITDFGVARLDVSNLTLVGESFGTPAYMAPEQLTGAATDGRSDLFSLGVILYTMLIGFRPFQGNSAKTISFKVINQEPVPVTSFHLDLSKDTEYVVARAMAKQPEARYQTGWEFAADLEDILAGKEPRSRRKHNVPVSAEVFRVAEGYRTLAAIKRPLAPQAGEPRVSEVAAVASNATMQSAGSVAKQNVATRPAWKWIPARAVARLVLAGVALGAVSSGVLIVGAERNSLRMADREIGMPAYVEEEMPHPAELPAPKGAARELVRAATPVSTAPRVSAIAHPAILQLALHHHFKQAELSVWVDGKLAYSSAVYGEPKKHLLVLHEVDATESHDIRLAEGEHDFRVRVESPESRYDASQMLHATVPRAPKSVLEIECGRQGIKLKLANAS